MPIGALLSHNITHTDTHMKTHLPIALRKALLAAMVAVSYVSYSTAGAEILESGNVAVNELNASTSDLVYEAKDGNVTIDRIETEDPQSITGLSIKAGQNTATDAGKIEIGLSNGLLVNMTMGAANGITIGGTTPDTGTDVLSITGKKDDTASSKITTDGDLVVNQRVDIHAGAGEAGELVVSVGGNVEFNGAETKFQGGEDGAIATLTAGGSVVFKNEKGATIGEGATVITTGSQKDVELLNGSGHNEIAGDVTATGKVNVEGGVNHIESVTNTADFSAQDGIHIKTVDNGEGINMAIVANASLSTVAGGIDMSAESDTDGNYVAKSTIKALDGDVGITGGAYATVVDSEVIAESGNVSISGDAASVTNSGVAAAGHVDIAGEADSADGTGIMDTKVDAGTVNIGRQNTATVIGSLDEADDKVSSLTASGQLDVKGSSVNISGETEIESTGGAVDISAHGADAGDVPALLVNGGRVEGAGAVSLSAQKGTAALSGVAASGKSAAVSGKEVEITGGSLLGADSATLNATDTATLSGTEVAAAAVLLHGGDYAAKDGTTIGQVGDKTADTVKTAPGGIGSLVLEASASDAQNRIVAQSEVNVAAAEFIDLQNGSEVAATDGKVLLSSALTNVDGATVSAGNADGIGSDGAVEITGSQANLIRNGATVSAAESVSVAATGSGAQEGNLISESTVTAGNGLVSIAAESSNNLLDAATVSAAGDTGKVVISGKANTIRNTTGITATGDIDITSTGNNNAAPGDGNLVHESELKSTSGDIYLTADVTNQVQAASVVQGGAVQLLAGDENIVEGVGTKVIAATGSVALVGTGNSVIGGASVSAEDDVELEAGTFNDVRGGSSVASTVGDVTMQGKVNIVADGSEVTAGGDIGLDCTGAATGMGNMVQDSTLDAEGSITLKNWNYVIGATLDAGQDVVVTTAEGELQRTGIQSSTLAAGRSVLIAGDTSSRADENLAVIHGADTSISSAGRDAAGTGIELNNAHVLEAGSIAANNGGNLVVRNRVDVENSTLSTGGGGFIVVDGPQTRGVAAPAVLNMKQGAALAGSLAGTGIINKSGGDALVLDYDHTSFNGTIYANGAKSSNAADGSVYDATNAGSWVQLAGPGVGADARMVLRNTDLVIESSSSAAPAETQIGTLDTTADSEPNLAATGNTLLADGSYTTDDNTRTDFRTVGSVLQVNAGTSGDVVHARDMRLSDATLLKLDAAVDDAGQLTADRIVADGRIDAAATRGLNSVSPAAAPGTARVYIGGQESLGDVAEGTRVSIMSGTMAGNINEDVLYDVEKSANGTYQRVLRDRNMHLENKGDGVDLVISRNYRSCAKDEASQRVADVIAGLSDNFHHSEGTLAASNDTLQRLVDAFDYTRSEAAAQAGLKSVVGQGSVLPMLMLYDASRHHLNQLRRQMEMPVCKWSGKGAPNRTSNAWGTYTGAHDTLAGDSYLGDYTRTANGALIGVDTSVSCNWRLGLSLGYETSTGEADDTEVAADAIFVDAYAAGVTGNFRHRASVGLAFTTFESGRQVFVDAGYHSFSGKVDSETDALTLNVGYEISSDYRINARSFLSRYLAFNLAWHNVDDSREDGIAGLGTATEYDKEWQADVALGVTYHRSFAAVPYQASAQFYANAAVHVELINDRSTATSRFGSAAWEAQSMKRDTVYFELGAGVVVPLSPVWTATAGAAVELGSEHTSVSGHAGVRYSF